MKPLGRFLTVLGVSLLALAGLSLVDAGGHVRAAAPTEELMLAFRFRSWMPFFFDHLSAAVTFAVMITFSLVLDPYDLGGRGRLLPAIRPVLVSVLVLGIVHGLWFGVVGPQVHLRLEQIAYRSDVARTSRDQVRTLTEAGDFEAALAAARLYRSAVGDGDEIEATIEDLRVRAGLARRHRRDTSRGVDPERAFEVTGLSVPELLTRARQALDEGRFYTAHYYAGIAADQSEFRREDALELQAEALNAIEDGIRRRQEHTERTLYQEKLAAYQLLQRGSDDARALIESYYRFLDLSQRVPDDPDVERYLSVAQERLRTISFFLDDALRVQALPGRTGLVFFNRRTETMRELVVAEKLVQAPTGDYFFHVEILRTFGDEDEDGDTVHLYAPYGKRIGDMLVLRAMERSGDSDEVAEAVITPRRITNGQTHGEMDTGSSRAVEESDALLPLTVPTDDLVLLSGGVDAYRTLSLTELIRAPTVYRIAGWAVQPVMVALMMRIARIVGFFVLVLVAVSWSWRGRSNYLGRPPVVVLLLIAVMPWAIWWTISLLRSTVEVAARAVPSHLSPPIALILWAGVMVLAVAAAVASLARRTIEP